jgi:hypothetical protein
LVLDAAAMAEPSFSPASLPSPSSLPVISRPNSWPNSRPDHITDGLADAFEPVLELAFDFIGGSLI